jgi:iron complex outermembrane receptor protein
MTKSNVACRSQVLAVALLAGTSLSSVPAFAQSTPEDDIYKAEIVVTSARKREESLLDTPIAITGFSGQELSQRGVATFTDLANQTPGFNLNANYSGRNDRTYAQLIIRGFTSSSPQVSAASMFIDGVPVSSSTAVSSIKNPARVEILKGPQAAYFGRQTFAGAINIVNREPADEFGGRVVGMAGTRNNYDVYGEIEGPVIGEVLGLRLTAGKWAKDGSYRNSFNNTTLGDQSSQSYSAFATFKPFDSLKIRAFGMYSQDKDGASPTGLISAYNVRGRDGSLVHVGQSNCTLTGYSSSVNGQGRPVQNPYFCGVAPDLARGPSANSTLDSVTEGFIAGGWAGLEDFGLARKFYHGHVNVDYEIGDTGLTLSSLTGHNRESYATLLDSDNVGSTLLVNPGPGGRAYYDFTFLSSVRNRDFSQEVRLSYDRGPINATLGASYLKATSVSRSGGGALPSPTIVPLRGGESKARTVGVFGALSYELDNGLSLSAEGRYQEDTLSAFSGQIGTTVRSNLILPVGFYPDGELLLKKTYKNFMPRVIVQYEFPGTDLMAYASWSKAVNPGRFNTQFLTQSASTTEAAYNAGVRVDVAPEKVTNYEIGVKGSLAGGAITFSSALYYAQWRDQANTIALSGTDSFGNPSLVNGTANTGSVNMKGIELDANWRVNRVISLQAGGAINDTDIRDYSYPLASQLTGVFDFRGKEMPNTSKYSAVAGIVLEDELSPNSDDTWFLRADYSFKSGVWSNAANVVRTRDRSLVNMRGGFQIDNLRLEAFVTNVFNNKDYISIADNYVLVPGFIYNAYNSSLVVGLPELRTAGVRAAIDF